jgi:hypothetical protein
VPQPTTLPLAQIIEVAKKNLKTFKMKAQKVPLIYVSEFRPAYFGSRKKRGLSDLFN